MYYKVLKQQKPVQGAQPAEPTLFIVEEEELNHFLHEQNEANCVLVFDEIPSRNLYLLCKDDD